jgi:hypothetical protein
MGLPASKQQGTRGGTKREREERERVGEEGREGGRTGVGDGEKGGRWNMPVTQQTTDKMHRESRVGIVAL